MIGINSTRKQKVHSLTGRITLPLLLDSFKAVKRNRGAAGIDKVSIKIFEANLVANLRALCRDLKNGSFEPFPLRRAYVPKNDKELRPLGIPAVRDRVAQEVVRRLLNPIFEPLFHDSSYGFRQGRNCHMAIRHALALHHHGLRVILDADVQAFFDNLLHPVIMKAVAAEVADGNILLNQLDWQLQERGYQFVRYADDFVVLCQSQAQAEGALHVVQQVLATLGLQLSIEKTRISTFRQGYSFLGFVLASHSRRMRSKSLQKFKDKVRRLTIRHHNFEPEVIIAKLNRVLQGTSRYFATSFSTCRWLFQKLDSWIRMRLRCMKFKRKRATDNYKLRNRTFHKLGLFSMEQFCIQQQSG